MKLLLLAAATAIFGAWAVAQPAQGRDIVRLMLSDVGDTRPRGCPNRWCACYMDLMLLEAGFSPHGSWRARDYVSYGKSARPMAVGAIMVMPHHVGVVAGMCANGGVQLVSGNYGNQVGLGCYSPKRAIAWRAPVK